MPSNASHLQTYLSGLYPREAIEFSFSCVLATEWCRDMRSSSENFHRVCPSRCKEEWPLANTSMHKCLSSELNSVNYFAFLFFRLRLTNCVRVSSSGSELTLKMNPLYIELLGSDFGLLACPLTSYYHTQHARAPRPPLSTKWTWSGCPRVWADQSVTVVGCILHHSVILCLYCAWGCMKVNDMGLFALLPLGKTFRIVS